MLENHYKIEGAKSHLPRNNSAISFTVSLSAFFLFFFIYDYIFLTALGLAFSLFVFLRLLKKIGKEVAIKEMIVLLAASQWVIGAKISYNLGKVHYKYYMYVEEDVYMNLVVPGLIMLYFGLSVIRNKLSISSISDYVNNNRYTLIVGARAILLVGVFSFLLSRFINISQLSFILYLSNLLIYVAAVYYMFLYPNQKNKIVLITVSFLMVLALQSGMFHNLIIVTSFLVFYFFSINASLIKKMVLIITGIITMYTIQLVKAEYRSIIWESNIKVNVFEAFYTVLEAEFSPKSNYNTVNLNPNEETEEQSNVTARLNQGWIISKVMDNVPKNQPFLNGKTVVEALKSSILPRFLFPEKKGVDQALVNFVKISGVKLSKGTSMGLSVIAEFYANFGLVGAWIAMFIYGLSLSLAIRFIINIVGHESPLILLWFLLFFFQVIKAETELMKIINHLVKSLLFFVFLRFGLSMINIELLPNKKNSENATN